MDCAPDLSTLTHVVQKIPRGGQDANLIRGWVTDKGHGRSREQEGITWILFMCNEQFLI